MYVAEFDKAIVEDTDVTSEKQKRDYTRGYFDADGSVPNDPEARFYICFAQQDRTNLQEVKRYLEGLGVETGSLHRPSKREAPEYWRFYVSTASHRAFAETIGSWHPRKRRLLREKVRSTP